MSVVMVSLVCLVGPGVWPGEGTSSRPQHGLESTSSFRAPQVDLEAEIRPRAGGGLHRSLWGCQTGFWDLELTVAMCSLYTGGRAAFQWPRSGAGWLRVARAWLSLGTRSLVPQGFCHRQEDEPHL